jgi:hypothetical protein
MHSSQDSHAPSNSHSRRSDHSHHSASTAPTSVYSIHTKSYEPSPTTIDNPRSSAETYLSGASEDDLCDDPESDPAYEVPEINLHRRGHADLRPSTPQDFAEILASAKRLSIRHDDTTCDGNMNLRVDTEDPFGGPRASIQLFHMRMQDLKKREFSLRRYERSSGREVCHSTRKYKSASDRRPKLTRSVSNALASIRGSKPRRIDSGLSSHSSQSSPSFRRQDSGYGSPPDEDSETADQVPTNTVKLEFSNYAIVNVARRGARSSKRYEFEYWGHAYAWRRSLDADGSISYHLHRDDGRITAHILPELRDANQVRAHARAGGWVPPCSMWVSDLDAATDVAE